MPIVTLFTSPKMIESIIRTGIVLVGAAFFWGSLLAIADGTFPLWLSIMLAIAGAGIVVAENGGIAIK